jgi:hypothetical protein
MSDEKYIGLPTMSLLPLTNVEFSSVQDLEITLPRTGNYAELAPLIFKEEDGDFNILDELSNTLYLPSVTKVMLACDKYPALTDNQLFTPQSFTFDEDNVVITGSILEIYRVVK